MSHSFQENLFEKIKVQISQGSLCSQVRNSLADCKLCVPLCSLSASIFVLCIDIGNVVSI